MGAADSDQGEAGLNTCGEPNFSHSAVMRMDIERVAGNVVG